MRPKYYLLLLVLPILFWVGCEDKEAEVDAAGAEAMADEAMDDIFEAMLAGDLESTSAIHDQFEDALESDPSNLTANFGAAFTTLASIGQNESLESTMDSWIDCLESLGMTDPLGRTIISNNETAFGIPTSLNEISSFDAAQFLSYLPIIKSHEFILMRGNEYDCPEIGSLQDLLEDTFLSQLTEAIDHLGKVVGEGFVFTITPEMMGDDGQSPINLDDTEIYLIKGVFHQLRALIYAVITYNVDIPYYDLMEEPDSTYNFPWLAQDASFLTIRSGQEQSLPNAHGDLNAVLSSLESAITFLQSDTDTENDLIQPDEGELTEMLEAINDAQSILSGPYSIEEEITVDISHFLNNPPANLKNILPGYTITAGPQLTWDATTCDAWKDGWDVTIGGLFPDFTTEMIFEDLSDDECSNILQGFSFDDGGDE